MKTKKLVMMLGGGATLIGVGYVAVNALTGPSAEAEVMYDTQKVTKVTPLTTSGTVAARQSETVGFPEGTLTLKVADGDQVAAGQVLATVYSQEKNRLALDAKATVDSAQLAVNNKQRALDNAKRAAATDTEATELKQAVTSAEDDLVAAKAELQSAQQKANLSQGDVTTTVTAPFAGTVVIENGGTGKPKVTIYSGERQVESSVTDFDYDKLQVDMPVEVKVTSTDLKDSEAHVTELATMSQNAKGKTTRYAFKTTINDQFKIGQKVTVSVPQDGVKVVSQAVVNKAGETYVYTVRDGKALKTPIAGHKDGGAYVVTEGLQPGATVVTNPGKDNLAGKQING